MYSIMDRWEIGFLCVLAYAVICAARDVASVVQWLFSWKTESTKVKDAVSPATYFPQKTATSLPLLKDLQCVYAIPGSRNKAMGLGRAYGKHTFGSTNFKIFE